MKLDRIDIKILYELQKNGRITNVELAELVNLSPSPCLMRVKKLQSEGYIEGYSAQINVGKLGQTLTVFTEITLKNHRQIDFARFLAADREDRPGDRVPSGLRRLRLSAEIRHRRHRRVSDDHGTPHRLGRRHRQIFQLRRAEVADRQGAHATDQPVSDVRLNLALRTLSDITLIEHETSAPQRRQ